MLKITHLKASNFETALRGLRNPMNSWDKSDSEFGIAEFEEIGDIIRSFVMEFSNSDEQTNSLCEYYTNNCVIDSFSNYDIYALIGPKDMELCQRLIAAGPEHAKFLRQINISFDISAPLYLLKEFDTYKIGTVRNSCSTMHKITSKEFELKDFSCEHLDIGSFSLLNDIIDLMNKHRDNYLNGNENLEKEGYTKKDYWWQLIQLLPTSYNQKATITMNYSVARNIIHQRKNHKLDEWHQFIDALRELPYSNELLFYNN